MKDTNKKWNKEINITGILGNKIVQVILNLIFGISVASLSLILIKDEVENYVYIIVPVLSFIIAEIMAFKFKFLKEIYKNYSCVRLFVSILLGLIAIYTIYKNIHEYANFPKLQIFVLFAIPAVIIFLYWFYTKLTYYVKKYLNSMDKVEKYFLTISTAILTIAIIFIYNMTNVFHYGRLNSKYYDYDIIHIYGAQNNDIYNAVMTNVYDNMNYDILYTTDTALLTYLDVYSNVDSKENDIRQPLFGLFSIPFSVVPKGISYIFPKSETIYPVFLAIVQGILALFSFTLIARLMKLKGIIKVLFLIFITVSFPTLLFLLNLEQYLMAFFYLIVFIYMSVNNIKDKDIAYIMATGSMLTTGILFPLLIKKDNLKEALKELFFTFLKCMAIFIISARIVLFFPQEINKQLGTIKEFSTAGENESSFSMYTNFAKNLIIFSDIEEISNVFAGKIYGREDISFRLTGRCPAIRAVGTENFSILGISIIVLAILGFILNRKDKFIQICFAWALFSFVLLYIIGWGMPENGLMLYTFYFSWAFICLIFKFIEKLFIKFPKIKNCIYSLLILGITPINLYGILQLILFGIKYYN